MVKRTRPFGEGRPVLPCAGDVRPSASRESRTSPIEPVGGSPQRVDRGLFRGQNRSVEADAMPEALAAVSNRVAQRFPDDSHTFFDGSVREGTRPSMVAR